MKVIVVAGTQSGVGKTSIAVGLMAAFRARGLRVQPFKVGPDFLDPMHHRVASCRESYNLDGWMLSREVNMTSFMRNAGDTDIAIVEGVMGLYDGRDGKTQTGSTAEMAKILGAPVVLVVDCFSLARSVAAMVHGYTSFDPELSFAGVIFNKVGGAAHVVWLKEAMEAAGIEIPVLGGIPKTDEMVMPERHLGLVMPNEILQSHAHYVEALGKIIERNLDLDLIFQLAAECPPVEEKESEVLEGTLGSVSPSASLSPSSKFVRIGVAKDEAFCFYYHEKLGTPAR